MTQDNLTLEEQVATDRKAIESEKQELEERLQNTVMEADVAKGRRDWAFEERDKIVTSTKFSPRENHHQKKTITPRK